MAVALQSAKIARNVVVKLIKLLMIQPNNTNLVVFKANEQNRALHEVWVCL
jgi:hypothetical protein